MFKTLALIITLGMMLGLLTACQPAKNLAPPTTVATVDLSRYQGAWYEIASHPNFFQNGCRCTQAHYQLKKDYLSVLNTCQKKGKTTQATAKGFVVPNSGNAKLKVQFFWPFTGDYWILAVAPDYKWALVGTANRKYFWILSRTPTLATARLQTLVQLAKAQGYPTEKIQYTTQDCQRTETQQ